MTSERQLTIGFPRMYNEPGERRAFLPSLIGLLANMDLDVYVEAGSGAGMGYSDDAYRATSPRVHIVDEATAYGQDIVVVLRAPEGRYELIRPGAILLSMLHFTTRPERVELLRRLGIEAIALDMVTGDNGQRLVQNLRDVARNGLAAAFDALERRWPPLLSADRLPVSVTVIGAGGVGKQAIELAVRCGDDARNERFMREGLPGVEVVVVDQNLSGDEAYFRRRLAQTDILVDATARRDTSRPVFPNAWLGWLPDHAIVCDLAVDPTCSTTTRRSCAGSRASPRATWISGSSDRTIRPGTACHRRSRASTDERSSPATRGRASGPRPAWSSTARR